MYQRGVRAQSARRHASSDQGARSAASLPPAMMPSDVECTFAPTLATGSTLSSQVRAAQPSSDRRDRLIGCSELVASSGGPCHVVRALRRVRCTSSNSAGPTLRLAPRHTRIIPRDVNVVQIGGSNVFERLAPTREELTSAESAREEKREARELDGATFKPQRLTAASDVSRRMQSGSPPGEADAFDRLYNHQTHASRAAKVTLTQSQAADGARRMVPVTSTMMRNDGAAGGGLGATTERGRAPQDRGCLCSSWRRDAPHKGSHDGSHEKSHQRSHRRSYPTIASNGFRINLVSDLCTTTESDRRSRRARATAAAHCCRWASRRPARTSRRPRRSARRRCRRGLVASRSRRRVVVLFAACGFIGSSTPVQWVSWGRVAMTPVRDGATDAGARRCDRPTCVNAIYLCRRRSAGGGVAMTPVGQKKCATIARRARGLALALAPASRIRQWRRGGRRRGDVTRGKRRAKSAMGRCDGRART